MQPIKYVLMMCPVCKVPMVTRYVEISHSFCWERLVECPHGCYSYKFANYCITVVIDKKFTFEFYIDEGYDRAMEIAKSIKNAVKALKYMNGGSNKLLLLKDKNEN